MVCFWESHTFLPPEDRTWMDVECSCHAELGQACRDPKATKFLGELLV